MMVPMHGNHPATAKAAHEQADKSAEPVHMEFHGSAFNPDTGDLAEQWQYVAMHQHHQNPPVSPRYSFCIWGQHHAFHPSIGNTQGQQHQLHAYCVPPPP